MVLIFILPIIYSSMDKKCRAIEILEKLKEEYSNVDGTSLNFKTPLDILIATILSARSTDEQINKITKALFKKYKTAKDYAKVPLEELQEDIKSSGFYRQKAQWIQEATRRIVDDYNGEVPDNMEDLTSLKGVARKTANIVLQNAFNKVKGIAVDTHVGRLSRRFGLTDEKYTDKIEKDLMKLFPQYEWMAVNYLLIKHGREICDARKPLCSNCILNELCLSAFTFDHDLKNKV
jgi:endonuclease-3